MNGTEIFTKIFVPQKASAPVQLRQDNSQRHTQSQRIAPHLIQANSLLQCSTAELMQVIEQEQRENPALDDADDDLLPDTPLPNVEDGVDSHDAERQATADEMELARYEFNATDLLAPPVRRRRF